MREADLEAERRAQERERVVDVVAIADERQDDAVQVAELLVEREQVREGLAGMLADREAVDDRDRRLGRELGHDLVRAGARHDRVDEPLEVLRDVADRLAGAHHDVLGEVDRVPAELGHPGLERDAGAQARALEHHREGAPAQRRVGVATLRAELGLERRRPREQHADLGRGQIGGADEVPPAQRDGRVAS